MKPEFFLAIVKRYKDALELVPEDFKTAELCLEAVKQNGYALQYVPENLKTTELCLEAVKKDGQSLIDVPILLQTAELCLDAVKQNGYALQYVPKSLKTAELCLEAIKKNGCALQYVPETIQTSELCLEAVKQSSHAIRYVPENLKTVELFKAANIEVTEIDCPWWRMENLEQTENPAICNKYESALEKGIKEIFKAEVEKICLRLVEFIETCRREGLLAMEKCLDREKLLEKDLLETGVQMAIDAVESKVISQYMDTWIAANCNNSIAYYEKILASIIKTGVLALQAGENPIIAEYKMTVLIPRDLIPDSLWPGKKGYFRNSKKEVEKV